MRDNGRIYGDDLASKIVLSPMWLRLLSVLRRWFCCCWILFIVAPIVCGGLEFGPWFVVQYLVLFLFFQSSR